MYNYYHYMVRLVLFFILCSFLAESAILTRLVQVSREGVVISKGGAYMNFQEDIVHVHTH